MAYSCGFGFRGNLDFPDFLQKQFYNIKYICEYDLADEALLLESMACLPFPGLDSDLKFISSGESKS